MTRILVICTMLAVVPGLVSSAWAQAIGIVLMHGKTGSPNTVINQLAIALQGCGIFVDTPASAVRCESDLKTAREWKRGARRVESAASHVAGLGVLSETLVIGIEERVQRQDPRIAFRPTTTRPADGNGEMDMWDALQIRT